MGAEAAPHPQKRGLFAVRGVGFLRLAERRAVARREFVL